MCANGRCYVSQEIIDFSKLDLFEARVLFRFFLVAQRSLSLPTYLGRSRASAWRV